MDPNSNLASTRRLLSIIEEDLDVNGHCQPHEVFRLCALIRAMDEWITHGGFLPAEWSTDTREQRAASEGKLDEYTRPKRGK